MPTPFRDEEKPAICFAMTAFLKMHGLGNDFIVLDARDPANGIPDVIGAAVATPWLYRVSRAGKPARSGPCFARS